MRNLNCNIDEILKWQTDKALPKKVLKNICGGESGFSRVLETPKFPRQVFYRLAHH